MKPSILSLSKKRPIILDGAMSSIFKRLGFPEGHHTGEWNLSHPDKVQEVHRTYWNAGADAVAANTWQTNRLQLSSFGHGLDKSHDEINRRGAELALEICPDDRYVFGDIGPTGKLFQPYDEVPISEAEQAFQDQATILIDAEVDFLVFETFYNLQELLAGINSVRQVSKSIPVIAMVSVQYKPQRKNWFTMMGNTLNQIFDATEAAGANIVGVNCIPSNDALEVAKIMTEATKLPLSIRPNAGKPHLKEGQAAHPITPQEFTDHLYAVRNLGIKFFGGCCGTNPKFIQLLRSKLIGDIEPPKNI